jgi:crotonobetainyl-CoA:carnitine CoA-transferase CaiB-like acyl-CoA transferase
LEKWLIVDVPFVAVLTYGDFEAWMKDGALSDLKILEYAQFISGPYCAKLMADLGAEVIKIEEPGLGDRARRYGPFPQDIPHPEKSGLFIYINSNKKGITLDLHAATGMKIFKELVKAADILVENNPPGVMRKLGLDYETLKEVNPRLIMASITPFGQTGPYRDYKATELITFHMSGLGYETPGVVDDCEKEPPLKPAGHQASFLGGVIGALLTLLALRSREASGLGQHIDLSEQESLASFARGAVASRSYGNPAMSRTKSQRPERFRPFMGIITCKGGYVCTIAIEDLHWESLMNLMGNPEWSKEEMCKDRQSRTTHGAVIEPKILEWTAQYTKEELTEMMQKAHIPCFGVADMAGVLSFDQLADRGFFVDIDHPVVGKVKCPGAPFKLSRTSWQLRSPAPLLGQHNEEIFCRRMGYTEQDMAMMRQAGVI